MNDPLLSGLRAVWNRHDPVPQGLVERMQAVVAAEAMLADADLDYELMLLVERSREMTGARGSTSYTLRFTLEDLDLLVRAAGSNGVPVTRLDGWLVPPADVTVRATQVGGEERSFEVQTDGHGRFEIHDLPVGLYRLWLTSRDPGRKPFATPAFEI